MAKIDAPMISSAVPVVEKRYVVVPQEDAFEFTHPCIMINGEKYGPGKHFVSNELAGEIEDRIAIFARGQVRLIRNGRDKAVQARNNKAALSQGGSANPEAF